MNWKCVAAVGIPLVIASAAWAQNQRDEAVLKDREQVQEDDAWFYDDLGQALEVAKESKRPLMVVFR